MLQNHDLHIVVTINGSWWLSGEPTSQHGNIVPSQNDGQPLSQLPGDLLFLLPQLPCELPPQLGEHIKGSAVPAPKGVHCQRYEGDAFCCAAVVLLGHLEVVGKFLTATTTSQIFTSLLSQFLAELLRVFRLKSNYVHQACKGIIGKACFGPMRAFLSWFHSHPQFPFPALDLFFYRTRV